MKNNGTTTVFLKLKDLKVNPNNPRLIKNDKFLKLVQSIKDFPEMLEVRTLVLNKEMVILGGNQRYRALIEAGVKEAHCIIVDWSEEKQREFVIKDNLSAGEHDWDIIANEYEDVFEDWGGEKPVNDFSDKNKEIDTDFEDQKYTFKLEYSESEYTLLKEKLQALGQTPEQIFYGALVKLL